MPTPEELAEAQWEQNMRDALAAGDTVIGSDGNPITSMPSAEPAVAAGTGFLGDLIGTGGGKPNKDDKTASVLEYMSRTGKVPDITKTGWYAPQGNQSYSGDPNTVAERDFITGFIDNYGVRPSTDDVAAWMQMQDQSDPRFREFTPTAVAYKQGFRSADDVYRARELAGDISGETPVSGPYSGALTPTGGIVITDDNGQPLYRAYQRGDRATEDALAKGNYIPFPQGGPEQYRRQAAFGDIPLSRFERDIQENPQSWDLTKYYPEAGFKSATSNAIPDFNELLKQRLSELDKQTVAPAGASTNLAAQDEQSAQTDRAQREEQVRRDTAIEYAGMVNQTSPEWFTSPQAQDIYLSTITGQWLTEAESEKERLQQEAEAEGERLVAEWVRNHTPEKPTVEGASNKAAYDKKLAAYQQNVSLYNANLDDFLFETERKLAANIDSEAKRLQSQIQKNIEALQKALASNPSVANLPGFVDTFAKASSAYMSGFEEAMLQQNQAQTDRQYGAGAYQVRAAAPTRAAAPAKAVAPPDPETVFVQYVSQLKLAPQDAAWLNGQFNSLASKWYQESKGQSDFGAWLDRYLSGGYQNYKNSLTPRDAGYTRGSGGRLPSRVIYGS